MNQLAPHRRRPATDVCQETRPAAAVGGGESRQQRGALGGAFPGVKGTALSRLGHATPRAGTRRFQQWGRTVPPVAEESRGGAGCSRQRQQPGVIVPSRGPPEEPAHEPASRPAPGAPPSSRRSRSRCCGSGAAGGSGHRPGPHLHGTPPRLRTCLPSLTPCNGAATRRPILPHGLCSSPPRAAAPQRCPGRVCFSFFPFSFLCLFPSLGVQRHPALAPPSLLRSGVKSRSSISLWTSSNRGLA